MRWLLAVETLEASRAVYSPGRVVRIAEVRLQHAIKEPHIARALDAEAHSMDVVEEREHVTEADEVDIL